MPPTEILGFAAGVAAGFLGALVGIGGGVLLVPLLNGLLGLAFSEARGVRLVGVLATASSAVTTTAGRRLINYRLAIFLLLFSVSGALLGTETLDLISDETAELIFGAAMAVIGAIMFMRRNIRNVLPAQTTDLGAFGGRIFDVDLNTDVAYRVRRVPLAAGVAFIAGLLASYIGIGGGVVIVPVLNAICRVPMRVAAATSVLMIGVTAVPGVVAHWSRGYLGDYYVTSATCIGVLIGFRIGLWMGPSAPVNVLKTGMGLLLAAISIQYLLFR